MPTDTAETPPTLTEIASARLRALADRIDLNGPSAFGGAMIVIPPANGGEPIELLLLDSAQEPVQWWGIVKTKVAMALSDIELKAQMQNTFPQRR